MTTDTNGWIRVEDRLPDKFRVVQVWTNCSLYAGLGLFATGKFTHWTDIEGPVHLPNEPHIEVLFWRELPEPPII